MFKPLVTIIFPVLEDYNYFDSSLQSLLNQSYKNLEIIIISNKQNLLEQKYVNIKNNIKVIYVKELNNASKALNTAISIMKGEFFSWILPGDVLVKEKIELQLSYIERQLDKTVPVYGNVAEYNIDTKKEYLISLENKYSLEYLENPSFMLAENILFARSFLFHISVLEKRNNFDEKLIYTYDYDFLYEVLKSKEKIIFVDSYLMSSATYCQDVGAIFPSQNTEIEKLISTFLNEITDSKILDIWGSRDVFLSRVRCAFLGYNFSENILEKLCVNENAKEECVSELKNKKIGIWGLGLKGVKLFNLLQSNHIYIDFFVDNDVSKQGKLYNGIKCLSPNEILGIEQDIALIIATKTSHNEISIQLNELGVKNIYFSESIEKLMINKVNILEKNINRGLIEISQSVDFLFVYEVKTRELENICLVASYLKNCGYSVGFVNSWKSLQDVSLKNKFKCKVLIISAGYNSDVISFFASHVIDFDHILNLQWEQILKNSVMKDKNNFCHFKGLAHNISHVSWGMKNYNRLVDFFGIATENVEMAGHISLDFFKERPSNFKSDKIKFLEKYNLSKYKKNILFISSFLNFNMPASMMKEINNSYNVYKQADLSQKSRAEILNWIEKYLCDEKNVAFIYRCHPTEMKIPLLKEMEKRVENFYIINEESIRPWILYSDISLTWISTALAEIWAAKRPCYTLRPYKIDYLEDAVIYNNAEFIETYEEFKTAIESEILAFPLEIKEMQEYYLLDETPAYKKISYALEKMLSKKSISYITKFYIAKYKNIENQLLAISGDTTDFTKFQIDEYSQEMIKRNYASDEELELIINKVSQLS